VARARRGYPALAVFEGHRHHAELILLASSSSFKGFAMAKSAKGKRRGSDENLFSISGAATALNRSNRTVTRALQGVRADEIRSGLKLWAMSTIIRCINERTRAPLVNAASTNAELRELFEQIDDADAEMRAIESLAGRRAYARKTLLPLLHEVDRAMRADGKACGEDERLTSLRCDQHLRVFLVSGLGPDATNACDWSPSECWSAYNSGYDDKGDEAA
jgi:hypothetical protein